MNINEYRDSNNFIKINKVDNTYNRYFIGFDAKTNSFLSTVSNAPFVSGPMIMNYYYSSDGGNSFVTDDF